MQLCLDVRKSTIVYQNLLYTPPRVFLCRKNMSLQEDCEEGDTDDDKEEKSPLPEYSRLRTVVVREVEVDGHEYVSYECSCHSFIRHK